MKILLSTCRNPHFATITEYIEIALKTAGYDILFFNDMNFVIPGRIRSRISYLHNLDLKFLNKKLFAQVRSFKPDVFLEVGGHRILPETVEDIKKCRVKTALLTIDAPRDFEPVAKAAPQYDYIFTGGSEAYEILKDAGVKNLHWLPFACDPDFHKPVSLTDDEKQIYGCNIAFVGSVHPELYPYRVKILESLSNYDLAIWGPGTEDLPSDSPLKPLIRGGKTPYNVWTKIYSAAKIVLCIHFKDLYGKIPCYQASPRVYEIMACKGFLMVDNQKDVLTLFRDREDLVVFKDIDDLKHLVAYYLHHPEERQKIAETGYKTVLSKHTYKHRIREMLSIIARVE